MRLALLTLYVLSLGWMKPAWAFQEPNSLKCLLQPILPPHGAFINQTPKNWGTLTLITEEVGATSSSYNPQLFLLLEINQRIPENQRMPGSPVKIQVSRRAFRPVSRRDGEPHLMIFANDYNSGSMLLRLALGKKNLDSSALPASTLEWNYYYRTDDNRMDSSFFAYRPICDAEFSYQGESYSLKERKAWLARFFSGFRLVP